MKEFHSAVKNTFPEKRIRLLCCDNANEYVMRNIKRFCDENGIHIELSISYNPELNDKAKRINRAVLEKTPVLIF